jgi:hypothetical protein
LAAVTRSVDAFKLVKNQTDKISLAAVELDGTLLRFVFNQTPEIILAAIEQNPAAVNHIDQSKL